MLFLYRLRFLKYTLTKIKNLIVRLFLLSIYFYACGIILISLSEGLNTAIQLSSIKHVFLYLCDYLKWCYYNWNYIRHGLIIRLIVSLAIPYFAYKAVANIKWKHLFKRLIIRIIAIIRKRRGNESKLNEKNKVDDTYVQNKVNLIKKVLMDDIEKTIDKRLYDIFIAKRRVEQKVFNNNE